MDNDYDRHNGGKRLLTDSVGEKRWTVTDRVGEKRWTMTDTMVERDGQ